MRKLILLFFSLFLLFVSPSFAQTQMNLPVTFDDATVNYGLVGFGGAEQSTVVTDPTLATNKVAKVIKTNTAELWAGTTITAVNASNFQTGFSANIPFTATEQKMNVRVWSPHTNIQVRLKVEDKNDPTKSVETEATFTGAASTWQVLEFNFANQAAGTAAINLAYSYNKASIFFNFGVTGATAGERTYYFDDVKFGATGGGGGLTQMNLPVTFDDATVDYGLVGFGGAEQSTVVTDPTLATNKVAKVIKTNTAELWAGTTITAVNASNFQTGFSANIPFTASVQKMNIRVWSPHTNIQVRLKVEDKNDPTKSVETEATFTGAASTWQVLEFNFANQAAGTAAINLAYSYNKASIFFNFGVTGATAGERTYYFDDVKFGATGGGGGGLTQMNLPVTFDDATVDYGLVGFGGAEQSTVVTDPTLASNKVAKVIKTNTAELWAGTTITAVNASNFQTGFSANIPFTASVQKMNIRVWSPHTNIQVRLKVEDKNDPTKSVETEATFTGAASTWQVLEFNFANQAAGTAAINLAYNYNKASIFFNFGVTGATAGERTYYFDDVKFGATGGGGGGLTQMNLPVTFDDATVDYGLVGFGGAEQSTIITDPTLASNKVAKVIKTNTAELWAGTTITAVNASNFQTGFSANIPFTATEQKMNVRVWSPHTNIQVRLKVEDKNDPTKSVETEATFTGAASTWQVLEFNFANQAAGTAAINLAYSYNKASIFFNFGVTGATAGERTYYFDDVKFGATGGGGGLTQMNLPVTFDDATVDYGLVGFGGAEQSTVVTDPTLATNKVAKVIKTNTAELWAGTTITAVNASNFQTGFSANIPFTASVQKMNIRVWSPHTNIQVRLKVEDKNDPTKSVETEATFTGAASTWQVLEFNFANQAAGTAAINLAYSYNKASIFFNFGVTGATAGERTYYFDDVKFGATGGGGGGLTQMNLPVTFDDATVDYGLVGFGGAEQSTVVTDPTLASNKVAKVIKTNTAELWAGTTITAVNASNFQTGFSANIPFTASVQKMNIRVWSPHTNIQVRLKVEDKNDPTKSVETEATFTGAASTWQVLEFNFANQAAGTAAINLAYNYNKASIFFNFGVTGATAGERTYYFDDVKFGATGGGGGGLTQMNLPVTFDDATVDYGLVGFGGAEQSTIITDPTLASNKVAKVIKTNTAELWAGTTITAVNASNFQTGFSANIPFTASVQKMNIRVWSPHTNIQVRLKVEDKNDPTKSVETEATFTGAASTWQVLEFNFANQAAGTAAINLAYNYNKASIFFNFGVTGATAGERTYYFDDVKFGATGGGGGGLTQMNLPVTFDDATVDYGLVGFGGAEQSTVVTDPTLATNKVAKVIKTATAELWAGTTITAVNASNFQTGFSANIPFTASVQKMNIRVWSPHTNIQVRLKVEDKNDPTKSVETEATFTGAASTWQVLEFNFANQAAGTAAINLAYNYNKASIFFNFGVTGATAGERTYYFDDVKFGATGGGGGGLTQMNLPVTFDDATVDYGLVGFGGAEQSTIVTDPTLATNKVAKVIKTNTAELWAGTTITAVNASNFQTGFSANIPFTASVQKMNIRVWSPHTNIQVRLKVEDKNDPTKSVETEATFTGAASTWQVLEFNFANQAAGTAAINLAYSYNKASIFFNFGTTGATAGERTYYFDDVKFGATGGGGGGLTQMTLPVTFDDATVDYGLVGFGGAEQSTVITDPTLATNKVAKVIKTATAELWAGTTITAVNASNFQTGFSANIPFTASVQKMNIRVWSPHTNIQVRLKVEDKNDPTKSVETEATFTGAASTWQVLEFNFANQAAGTAAINLAYNYNKASIFFNFGVTGATAGERTYYFDDVKFGPGPVVLSQMNLPVTFDDVTVNYGLVGFGGAEQSTVVTDPTLATNKVGKVIKTAAAELWAGTTITAVVATVETGFATNIPFTATDQKMNIRVWSPHTNIPVRFKVEDKTDPTKSVETEAMFTGTAGSWQTLEFNFANQVPGTAAINLTYSYNKASIFFNFGTTGATAGERTYYFDNVKFGAVPVTPPPVVSTPLTYCQFASASSLTATAQPGNTLKWYTVSTGGTGSTTAPTPSTATPGTTNYYVSQVTADQIESIRVLIAVTVNSTPAAPAVVSAPINYCLNATAQVLTAQGASGNTLKWYTAAVGGTASLTAPVPATNAVGNISYYVSQTNAFGCESTRAQIVVSTKANPPTAFIVAVPNPTLQPGQTVSVTTTAGAVNSFAWYRDGVLLTGQTSNSVTADVDRLGTYSLKLTNIDGCTSTSNNVVVSGVERKKLFIYPNPSTGQFQVRYFSDVNNLSPRRLNIYNSEGKLVYQSVNIISGAYTPINVDLRNQASGIYMVHLMDNDGKTIKTERVKISH